MKRLALLFSMFTLVFAFTVTTVSAQKVTGNDKPSVEKSDAKTKACCAEKKSCCSQKSASSSCSKKCGDAQKSECVKQKETKTDEVPVPKKN